MFRLKWSERNTQRSAAGTALLAFAFAVVGVSLPVASIWGQELASSSNASELTAPAPAGKQDSAIYLSYAHFRIPYSVTAQGGTPLDVQLWVSTDEGESWQKQASATSEGKHFDFRAASEGVYLFSVRIVDSDGVSFQNDAPPMRVEVDTTKPRAALRADIDAQGQLVVDLRMRDANVDIDTATLRLRSDRQEEWMQFSVGDFSLVDGLYESQLVVELQPCREVALVFSVTDRAGNRVQEPLTYKMPRTANSSNDMTLASTRNEGSQGSRFTASTDSAPSNSRLRTMRGATAWEPSPEPSPKPETQPQNSQSVGDRVEPARRQGPGHLAAGELELTLDAPAEELPLPPGLSTEPLPSLPAIPVQEYGALLTEVSESPGIEHPASIDQQADTERPLNPSNLGGAFQCNSRTFSLDYSVDSLGGTALAEVELWGTDDGGRSWEQWGKDPDRESPFDVKVGADGLFGYRMVIVGRNGLISNRPKDGDTADVWINIDTQKPVARITRAMYGEGREDGMLVIDYTCGDSNLTSRPITLFYSASGDGEWKRIAAGLKNSELYIWKPPTNLPEQIYLKLEAMDKAGNVGVYRLDFPIDVKGLAPRGRIKGVRPILSPDATN